ncbi:MAG TPA: hypothetical protein VD837_06870 [Terriglobales bacterium]|nr:hypothetical protein [Terriglobales bacterium]
MLIRLNKTSHRVFAVVVALVAAGSYMLPVSRAYVASRKGQITNGPDAIRAAIRLEPANAEYPCRLARYLLFVSQDAARAVDSYRDCVALNPWVAQNWLHLAAAYNILGDSVAQQTALERAVSLDPRTPDIAWEAGNFYIIRGDVRRAVQLFRQVIENDPDKAPTAISLAVRAGASTELILSEGLPESVERHLLLLYYLAEIGKTDDAVRVWSHILTMGQDFQARLAYPYIDLLIREKHGAEAVRVWESLARMRGNSSLRTRTQVVVNGGFEDAISNGGFDWRYSPVPSTRLFIDTVEAHSGSRSMAIEFEGAPVTDIGLTQYVPVAPGHRYEFSAYMRTDKLQSSSGPRFAIDDAYTHERLALSDDMLETNVWRHRQVVLDVPGGTEVIALKVVRDPSEKEIKGKAWIDDLSLRRLD